MTTTIGAIRDQLALVFEAATPSVLPTDKFNRCPDRDLTLVEWCVNNASDQCLRKFDIWRTSGTTDPNKLDPAEVQRTDEQLTITVAYPRLPRLYGTEGLASMDDVMRRDARQLRDLCMSGSSLISGWSGVTDVTIDPPNRDGEVWFQSIVITTNYCEAQTLT